MSGSEQRFIISKRADSASPVNLSEVLPVIQADSRASIIRMAGSPENPEWLVVRMDVDLAAELARRFGSGLIIEADQALRGPDIPFGS